MALYWIILLASIALIVVAKDVVALEVATGANTKGICQSSGYLMKKPASNASRKFGKISDDDDDDDDDDGDDDDCCDEDDEDHDHDSDHDHDRHHHRCRMGQRYPTFTCSPPVSSETPAILTQRAYKRRKLAKGSCDGEVHSGEELVVALSTGWLRNPVNRCGRSIIIGGNGRSVVAKVVGECDSRNGCDRRSQYRIPCINNAIDASPAVWEALGVSSMTTQHQQIAVSWTDSQPHLPQHKAL